MALAIGALPITPSLTSGTEGSPDVIPTTNPAYPAASASSSSQSASTPTPTPTPPPTPPPPSDPPTDPAAAAAAAAAAATQDKINQLIVTGTNAAQAGGVGGTAAGNQQLTDLGTNANVAITGQQNAIDEARKEIGVTQINSVKQLQNTIKDGLQGTGVELGDSNALSSSAAQAAARAYANYGNVGTNTANNTAAVANEGQDVQQSDLEVIKAADKTQLDSARDAAVQSITAQAAQALDALQTQITYLGGDPNSVNVQQIKQGIVQSAQDDLAQIDSNYQNMINGSAPATSDQTAQAAEAASNAGVVPSSGTPYSTTNITQNPATASTTTSGTAPPPSLIPLTLGSTKTDTTGV